MMTSRSPYPRILRRETHSPRSVAAITLAVVLILLAAWLATEAVLRLLNQPALLAEPADMAAVVADAPAVDPSLLLPIGIAAVVVGLALVIVAVLPGRLARHHFTTDRSAVVVDNEVIASSIARQAAHAGGVSPDNATVGVSHRVATVTLCPSSGYPVDADAIRAATVREIDRIDVRPGLTARVVVDAAGKVGA